MKENNYHILRKAIADLPAYRLKTDNAWPEISKRLASNKNAVDLLPEYKAPDYLWGRIEMQLDNNRITNHKGWFPLRNFSRYAAAIGILMLLGAGWIVIHKVLKQTTVRYETLTEVETQNSNEKFKKESVFDPVLCKSNPQVCSTSLFKELDMQWKEVIDEIELLKPELNNNDPQLTRYFYRLDDLRIEIEKKMVKLILET